MSYNKKPYDEDYHYGSVEEDLSGCSLIMYFFFLLALISLIIFMVLL